MKSPTHQTSFSRTYVRGPAATLQAFSRCALFFAAVSLTTGCVLEIDPELGSDMQSLGYGGSIDLRRADVVNDVILQFAPTVYFHPNELYFTDSVDNYLNNVNLWGGGITNVDDFDTFNIGFSGWLEDWNQHGLVDGVSAISWALSSEGVPYAERFFWLAATDATNQAGSLVDTRVYVQASGDIAADTLEIQYWYFYPYNGPGRYEVCESGSSCSRHQASTVGRHEGDWENVNVLLNLTTGAVVSVTLSAHGDNKERMAQLSWENGTHPVVYSAKYSHAFYESTGYHDYERVWSVNYVLGTASVDLYDEAGAGAVHRPGNNDIQVVASNIPSLAVQEPEWLGFEGRWGAYERLTHSHTVNYVGDVYTYNFKEIGAGPTRKFDAGAPLDIPPSCDSYLVGDWDGDGLDEIALRSGNRFLLNTGNDGAHDIEFTFGNGDAEDAYLVGDWDGDGLDEIAIRRGNRFLLNTGNDGGYDIEFTFGNGNAEDAYLVGDWDGDGRDEIAIRRGNAFLLNTGNDGAHDIYFTFGNGNAEDAYLVGDWDGDGLDEIAIRRSHAFLLNTGNDGAHDIYFTFGNGECTD